jgi:hypothetical protein
LYVSGIDEILLSIYIHLIGETFQPLAVAILLLQNGSPQLSVMLQVLANAAPVGKAANTWFIASGDRFRLVKFQGETLGGTRVAACFKLGQF